VLAVILALATLACGGEATEPPGLIGVWRTEAPAYRDRKLEVQQDWISFGIGGASTASYLRDGVEVEPTPGGGLLCTLYYLDREGGRTHVRLVFEPGPPERLRFQNRDELWFREADAPSPGKKG
jgi:hypothetical protein